MTAIELTWEHPDGLHVAILRVEVAVDLIPLISTMIEDHDGRLAVVADVVDCWLRLPEEVRAAYHSKPAYRGLSRFVGDYVDGIDCAWVASYPGDPDAVRNGEAEQLCRRAWRQHEAEVLQRLVSNKPPSDAWLQRITTGTTDG